eukprot:CAMPEP_0113506880 /NCGR_PEP_ID=MMETSP0014_2-20120614/36152_1 /TAXON_ID=2857 /ORGANISM="Nitzschia sp." /LENGTH=198 /DNA_ID=CAMNT_0000402421 /DNA_START=20 /DNA_END=616 /DNA_ORIENTATION=+ /assembly_acc=CAM_ASM_000159
MMHAYILSRPERFVRTVGRRFLSSQFSPVVAAQTRIGRHTSIPLQTSLLRSPSTANRQPPSPFHRQQQRWHGGPEVAGDAPSVSITFVQPDSTEKTVEAKVGSSFLQVAHANDIDLEGACEGVCACSTCHLIFPMETFDTLEEASEDEEDMLDMAFGLTETSRLGCQITVTTDMDGLTVQMPSATRNFYVDGHVPKPH